MDKIFLDTSALTAFFDRKDFHHADAARLFGKIAHEKRRIVTTDYVLNECVTTILMRTNHGNAVKAAEFIFASKAVEFVWLDELTKRKAWEYFKKHSDKKYSFADCTSFVLMKAMKISKSLSFDDHFRQAGFVSIS
jgi:uncharacterized protein